MTEQTSQMETSLPCSPWRRAQKPAAVAFGLGFLLAGLASTDRIPPRLALSPEVLTSLIAGLTVGLLCASAIYVFAVLFCSFRRTGPRTNPDGTSSESPTDEGGGGDAIASFLVMTLLVIVCLQEVLKHTS